MNALGDNALWMFNAACTAASAGCAVFVAVRDNRWRKTGLAKQLEDRIAMAQKSADNWHESPHCLALQRDIAAQGGILTRHATILENVATRTDIARIEGEAHKTQSMVKHASESIDRIEGILLRRALAGRVLE